MNWEERINSLEKVKYAEMTELEKLAALREACMDICYDMINGHCRYQMNNDWYGKVLKIMSDCGYDTSEIKEADWNNLQNVAFICQEVLSSVEKNFTAFRKMQGEDRCIFSRLYLTAMIYNYFSAG